MATGYTRTTTTVGIIATLVVALMLVTTNPLGVGPLGVTAWFLALLVALSSWFGLLAHWLGQHLPALRSGGRVEADSWRRGLLAGGYITILLGLSSLQQLALRDALILGMLLLLIEFYLVARR